MNVEPHNFRRPTPYFQCPMSSLHFFDIRRWTFDIEKQRSIQVYLKRDRHMNRNFPIPFIPLYLYPLIPYTLYLNSSLHSKNNPIPPFSCLRSMISITRGQNIRGA